MQYQKSCCRGRGYKITAIAHLAQATLCECVQQCLSCLGTLNRPTADGTAQACAQPDPRRFVRLFNQSGIPARYRDSTIEGFRNDSGNWKAVQKPLTQWLNSISSPESQGLILSGSVGVGKTHLLVGVARHLMERGFSVKFRDLPQLLAELRAGFGEKTSEMTVIKPLIEVDFLIVDELGCGRASDWETKVVDLLISGRYNRQRTLIAGTNYEFGQGSERIVLNARKRIATSALDRPDSGGGSAATPGGHRDGAGNFGHDTAAFGSLESRLGQKVFSRLCEMCVLLTLHGNDWRRRGVMRQS